MSTVVGALVFAGLLSACADKPPSAVLGVTTALLSSLKTDVHAVTLAVNGTLRLTTAAYNTVGDTLSNASDVVWTSEDARLVTVTSDGLITGVATTAGPVMVIASLQRDSVTRADTVLVTVTPTAFPPSTFKLEINGDTARFGIGGSCAVLGATITTNGGRDTLLIPSYADTGAVFVDSLNIPVSYSISSPNLARVNPVQGFICPNGLGKTMVYASASLYGVTYTDSTEFLFGYAGSATFSLVQNTGLWDHATATVMPNGAVFWSNFGQTDMAITFDKPDAVSPGPIDFFNTDSIGGDIPAFHGSRKARTFKIPGTYTWHSGTQTGQVVVPADAYPVK